MGTENRAVVTGLRGGLGYQGAGGQMGGAVMDLLFILIMVAIIQLSPFVKTHKNV